MQIASGAATRALNRVNPWIRLLMLSNTLVRKNSHLWWRVRVSALRLFNARAAKRSEARQVFENEVLFAVSHVLRPRRILSVGVARYTRFYERLFPGAVFETVDIDPGNAQWGSKQRHYVGGIAELPPQTDGSKYDVVLFNGVYGWGVNSSSDLSASLEAMASMLADDGVMVFGWNCVPSRDPLGLGTDFGRWFRQFAPAVVNGTDTIHVERSNGQRFKYLRLLPGDVSPRA